MPDGELSLIRRCHSCKQQIIISVSGCFRFTMLPVPGTYWEPGTRWLHKSTCIVVWERWRVHTTRVIHAVEGLQSARGGGQGVMLFFVSYGLTLTNTVFHYFHKLAQKKIKGNPAQHNTVIDTGLNESPLKPSGNE